MKINTNTGMTVDKIYARGKKRTVWGSVLAVLFIFGLIGSFQQGNSFDAGTMFLSIVLIFLSLLLLYSGIVLKGLTKLYRSYVTILSADPTGSIDVLAANTGASSALVIKNLQRMIKKNFFTNAYIDFQRNRIVISGQETAGEYKPEYHSEAKPELLRVSCKGCGAVSTIPAGSDAECEYCGSKLL